MCRGRCAFDRDIALMRAQLLERPGPHAALQLVEVPDPEPGPGELRLRLVACAVCRTDLQLVRGDLDARRLPVVPGHQAVGRVAAVGAGVEGWAVGDRAGVAWLAGACGACAYCRRGNENLCVEAAFTGWDRDGGYAEAMTVRAEYALRLTDGFEDLAAAPLLCGGVIGYRSLKRSGIQPGGRLGLYGFGASASLAIQVAVHWGCEVYVVTRSEAERDRALALGARWAGTYEVAPPVPLDAAVTFAPAGEVVIAALRALDRGGTVAINAIHLDRVPQFDYDDLWWERALVSVANFTRQDAREFLELAASIPIETNIENYPLAKANAALANLEAGRTHGTAVLEM
jgi:propanol-preferring alcohol dehydrogenase